ncbi:MAG: PEP/pyruvate-binding domain-containing protein [Chloroflexota bacterium]|nr:PEP/pyruvate-binding domain-containing protein [Chloroflexota bacterium]
MSNLTESLANNTTLPLPKVLEVYLHLANFPILSDRIREDMRREIFSRGVVSKEAFEKEVEEKAVQSQVREGLQNPFSEESPETWQRRMRQIRDHLTDFYFAYNLPRRLLEELIQEELGASTGEDSEMAFNPELAPWDVLFAKGRYYESLPPERQAEVHHHLQEIKVVLIRAMISDQLAFVGIAREFFTIEDLEEIRRHRIGRGKIGGKAAGLMLAWKILQRSPDTAGTGLQDHLSVPESFFVGADVFYGFLELNDLLDDINQKYKSSEEIIADFRGLPERFSEGRFPDRIVEDLSMLLDQLGPVPLIVRSSSLLEDNVSTSFAGKYESVFCPNQGTPEENLKSLLCAITQVYASALNPDALFYRRRMGLIDYDERMAVIIQRVQGSKHKNLFFPTLAGVGFSHNPFIWTSRIKRKEGFVRLVTGLGTRAVDRVPDDYPRMIGLSHPQLRPAKGARQIQHYSQHYMEVVDLEANSLATLPTGSVIDEQYPWLRLMASVNQGTYIEPILSSATKVSAHQLVLTLDELVKRTDFVPLMKKILATLRTAYGCPVDVEFTVELCGSTRKPEVIIHLLQCRPQSSRDQDQDTWVPTDVPLEDQLFTANYLIPSGTVDRIRYIVFVDPAQYARLAMPSDKLEVARAVGRLNRALQGQQFILIGPGRWGSSNLDLGVKVTYADIFNTRMLIELGVRYGNAAPEVSHGTHFFQDLVEARIFPLAVFPDNKETLFDERFFAEASNRLHELLPEDAALAGTLKVIDVPAIRDGKYLEVVMSADQEKALGYFRTY